MQAMTMFLGAVRSENVYDSPTDADCKLLYDCHHRVLVFQFPSSVCE